MSAAVQPKYICMGPLSERYRSKLPVCDLTELIRTEEGDALLHFLQDAPAKPFCSHYDFFAALCRAMPQLIGHPYPKACSHVLRACLQIDLPLCEENAEQIWKLANDQLFESPKSLWEHIAPLMQDHTVLALTEASQDISSLPEGVQPVLFGNTLPMYAENWASLRTRLCDCLNGFAAAGCSSVYFELQEEMCACIPDLYHVELSLRETNRTMEQTFLLSVQMLRFLCEECRLRGWTLHLRLCEHADKLLQMLDRQVGLPHILWSVESNNLRNQWLKNTINDPKARLQYAMMTKDYPSDSELSASLQTLSARYPMGNTVIIGTSEFCFASYECERLEKIFLLLEDQ